MSIEAIKRITKLIVTPVEHGQSYDPDVYAYVITEYYTDGTKLTALKVGSEGGKGSIDIPLELVEEAIALHKEKIKA